MFMHLSTDPRCVQVSGAQLEQLAVLHDLVAADAAAELPGAVLDAALQGPQAALQNLREAQLRGDVGGGLVPDASLARSPGALFRAYRCIYKRTARGSVAACGDTITSKTGHRPAVLTTFSVTFPPCRDDNGPRPIL